MSTGTGKGAREAAILAQRTQWIHADTLEQPPTKPDCARCTSDTTPPARHLIAPETLTTNAATRRQPTRTCKCKPTSKGKQQRGGSPRVTVCHAETEHDPVAMPAASRAQVTMMALAARDDATPLHEVAPLSEGAPL
jgi:hypothetical protein